MTTQHEDEKEQAVSRVKDTEVEAALQSVRDALSDDDKYYAAAEAVAELRGWRRSSCPFQTRKRFRDQLSRLLGSGRNCSLRDYAAIVAALRRSPIDFARFAGGQAA
jgi:CRISPR/Cas system-associated exonuclease Cas4 (RecB family)